MINAIQKQLLSLAQNCSKNGFIISTHADIILLKETFGISDIELCKILGEMKCNGLLKEFKIQYSGNGTLYKYWFK